MHYIQNLETEGIESFEDHELPFGAVISGNDEYGFPWFGVIDKHLGEISFGSFKIKEYDLRFHDGCALSQLSDIRIESIRDNEGNITHKPEWVWKIKETGEVVGEYYYLNCIDKDDFEKALVWVEFGGKGE